MKALPFLICLVLVCLPIQAQDPPLELIYTSPPGTEPLGYISRHEDEIDFFSFQDGDDPLTRLQDANGDGQPDLVMTRRNEQGHIDGVLVIDGATQEEILRMEAELEDEFADMELVGFIDLGMGGIRPALFAGEEMARLTDLTDGTSDFADMDWGTHRPIRLVGVGDLTGNGLPELVFYLPDAVQIEAWGTP